jgi:hypothetical protein
MRHVFSALVVVSAISGMLAAAPIASAASTPLAAPKTATAPGGAAVPQAHTSGPVCSASLNACEEVFNTAQGSDTIDYVIVYDGNNQGIYATYRLLFGGSVGYAVTGNGPAQFGPTIGGVRHGTCIQGGIVGLPDARTPCWYAP